MTKHRRHGGAVSAARKPDEGRSSPRSMSAAGYIAALEVYLDHRDALCPPPPIVTARAIVDAALAKSIARRRGKR